MVVYFFYTVFITFGIKHLSNTTKKGTEKVS